LDIGGGAADGAVDIRDALDAVLELGPRVDVTGLEYDAPPQLLHGQDLVAGDVDAAHPELWALRHHDPDGDAGIGAVDLRVDGLDPGLDVAVVVVEGHHPLDVLIELLTLHGSPEDEELSLLSEHDLLDLVRPETLSAFDDNLVDGHSPALGDTEGDADVPVGQLDHIGTDAHLEVALLLVGLLQLLGRPRHLDGVVHTAELHVDLLLQGGGVEALVPREVQIADEGSLTHHEGQLHSAFEVLHLGLDVVEEAQGEDRADVVREARGYEGTSHFGRHAAEDDRLLHAAVALHPQLLHEDLRSRGRTGGGLGERGVEEAGPRPGQGQDKKNGESESPPRGHHSWKIAIRDALS
jgi:hypothetical protein